MIHGNLSLSIVFEVVDEMKSCVASYSSSSSSSFPVFSSNDEQEPPSSVDPIDSIIADSSTDPNVVVQQTSESGVPGAYAASSLEVGSVEEDGVVEEGTTDHPSSRVSSRKDGASLAPALVVSGEHVDAGAAWKSEDFSGVVKETRELPREESSSESTADGWPKGEEKSEELQRDYPLPIYNYNGQDEVEFVKLNHENETRSNDEGSFEVKTNDVPRRSIGDLRVITREESDEEFLREFERKFEEASVESESPSIHQVKIVEVPVDRSRPPTPSPHRVLVNITIASGDPAASRPLYVLSVSVPTGGGEVVDGEEEEASEPSEESGKMARPGAGGDENRLPPPPQPPSSPPPPMWAGGECECSCPCMGSSSDEWDNFSAVDETRFDQQEELQQRSESADEFHRNSSRQVERREEGRASSGSLEEEEEEEVKGETSSQHDYFSGSEENSSTIEWTTSNYETAESGGGVSGCSGTTPLPPEPTILILEGEAPFTIVF